jgi:MFS family permease
MARSKYFELLTDWNFIFLWIGVIFFSLGGMIFTVSLNWWVLEETNSEIQLGIVNTLTILPMILFVFISGIFTDIFNRKKLMIYFISLRGISIILIPFLNIFQLLNLWVVYILAFLQGVSFPFFLNAINALMPQIIKKDLLFPANALVDSAMWLANIIGSFSSGFLIEYIGAMNLLLITGVTFIIGALLFGFIKYSFKRTAEKISFYSFFSDIKSGMKLMVKDRPLFMLILTWMGVMTLFANGVTTIGWPVFSKRVLNAGAEGYGLLVTVNALSSLIGSLIIGHWGDKIRKGFLVLSGYLLGAVGMLVFSFTTNFFIALIIMFVWSFYFPLINLAYWTVMMERIPQESMGKINGAAFTIGSGLAPISTFFTGIIFERYLIIIPFLLVSMAFAFCFVLFISNEESRTLK